MGSIPPAPLDKGVPKAGGSTLDKGGDEDGGIEGKAIGIDLGLTHFAITSNGSKYDNPRHLAKCTEPLAIRWSRQIPESCEPSTVTVRLHPSGRWHISIRFDDPTIKPLPVTDKAIGIDLGISSLVITSDGDKVSNPKHFNKHYRRLQKAQKNLSRKQKGSKNREKATNYLAVFTSLRELSLSCQT